MSSDPMVRCGDALVVYDGPHRLIWNRIGATRWMPCRLWPNSTEAAEVTDRSRNEDPVLIILDRRPAPVHVLVEELAAAPPAVTDLVRSVSGDVAELWIPPLTWLPDHLQQRGQRLLQDVATTMADTPTPLLPSLILQPRVEASDNVWFGLRVRSTSWSMDELMAVVDHLRAERGHVLVGARRDDRTWG